MKPLRGFHLLSFHFVKAMKQTIHLAIQYIYLTWTNSHLTHIFSIPEIQKCAKREQIIFLCIPEIQMFAKREQIIFLYLKFKWVQNGNK